ncbi:ComF family protein [Cellulosimicrobium protaetiae]|uniref:ComF family protein n=1 Tax=Cellulosimicrobium protaetiae TaxID=2587808 RepID=UPI001C124FAB|nr:ComF family protein [Cellulosimicrobium protaetiae]
MLRQALDDVTRLVLPVACPGCGLPDVRWCRACVAPLVAPPRRRERGVPRLDRLDGVPPLPVWAPADYAGPVRGVVVAWKDRGRADLDRPLGGAASRAGAAVGRLLLAGSPAPLPPRAAVLVVPAPTSAAARRARGRDPVAVLARSVASGLVATGVAARTAPLLGQRGHPRDQVGLGARARGARLGTVGLATGPAARRRAEDARRDRVACLLVDDVVTTGATLAACETALADAGLPVLGALVLAATPAPAERREPVVGPSRGAPWQPGRRSSGSPPVGAADTLARGLV